MRYFLVVTISFLLSSTLYSQQTFSFGASYSIGIESFEEANSAGSLPFGTLEDEYPESSISYSSWLFSQYSVLGEYQVFGFMDAGLKLGYGTAIYDPSEEGSAEFRVSNDLSITDFRIQPKLGFDALAKSETEALKLNVGLSIFHRNQQSELTINSDSVSYPLKEMVVSRTGWGTAWFVGLEWEDYFSENLGYFLAFRYYPGYSFKPSKAVRERYVLDGVETDRGNSEILADEMASNFNDGSREEFTMNAIYFSIGLKYAL